MRPSQVSSEAVDELEGRLRAINSLARMTRTSKSAVPLDYVLGVGGFDLDKVEEQVGGLGGGGLGGRGSPFAVA